MQSGLTPGFVHMKFGVEKMALGQDFPRVLRFTHVDIIPSWLSTLICLGDEQQAPQRP
jgi:hypothetical protein